MMKTETKPYNPFDHLLTQADMGDYLTQAFLDDDPAVFVTALGHVAKAKGIAQLPIQGLTVKAFTKPCPVKRSLNGILCSASSRL